MLVGKKVKIRWRRSFAEERVRVMVGVVTEMTGSLIRATGRFFFLAKGEAEPRVDETPKDVVIPIAAINLIRVLPDDMDLDNLEYETVWNRIVIKVPREESTTVSE